MAHESSIVLGSGLNSKRDDMRVLANPVTSQIPMRGTSVVVLNPEDASVFGPLRSQQITVGSTAQAIPASPYEYRRAIAIYNESTTSVVYIGGPDVTTANGFPLLPGEKFAIDASAKAIVYAITSSSISIRIIEVR